MSAMGRATPRAWSLTCPAESFRPRLATCSALHRQCRRKSRIAFGPFGSADVAKVALPAMSGMVAMTVLRSLNVIDPPSVLPTRPLILTVAVSVTSWPRIDDLGFAPSTVCVAAGRPFGVGAAVGGGAGGGV